MSYSTGFVNENKQRSIEIKKDRRAVRDGLARYLHSRPRSVEVTRPTTTPVRHERTRFGYGLLRSVPSYRLDCTLADADWWAEESRREEDRLFDRMAAESAAMDRMENGLDC